MRNELFRLKLQEELVTRATKNPSFSARAFAKKLDIGTSSLTQIINGKRPLTDKMCKKISERLGYSPDEVSALMRIAPESNKPASFPNMTVDMFKVIADWYHYAILELTYLEHFKGDHKWIAKSLGITTHEVRAAVERLLRLDFLEITEDNIWIDTLGDANNPGNEFTAPAMRKLQKQVLEKAIDALENVPYEERIQSSITLPVSRARAAEAKQKVLDFMNELDTFLREDPEKDEVYNMSFSLYPISDTRNQK